MTYIRTIANRIKEAVPNERLPGGDSTLLFDLYAALALSRGERTTRRDVHDAWVVWMLAKNERHPAMIPFEQLPSAIRAEDEPFVAAIRNVASTNRKRTQT